MQKSLSQLVREHRDIYHFGGRWLRTLLLPVPWITALIVAVLLYFIHGKLAVVPGVAFDLPSAAPEFSGTSVLTALMTTFARDAASSDEVMVFFDDDRFFLTESSDCDMLRELLRERVGQLSGKVSMVLMADKHVRHAELVRFANLAKDAGISRLNIAVKPEQ